MLRSISWRVPINSRRFKIAQSKISRSMLRSLIRHHEFWHPRVFELPFYIYLLLQCALHRVPVRGLAKANYGLDHGEIGIGSKFQTQMQFPQARFLPTILLDASHSRADCVAQALAFAREQQFPLILKPNIGMVGKGILKVHDEAGLSRRVEALDQSFILQKYCGLENEYGVFYVRQNGHSKITGINKKHFPCVQGDGKSTLGDLARRHERYSGHWPAFLQYHDLGQVPAEGEIVRLSFIGSHTMGCMFTDESHLLSGELEKEIFAICDAHPGFNYGRLDVRSTSDEALVDGDFAVIEVNGVSSLPTHMFDPAKKLHAAYAIFFEHGKFLTEIAREHRGQSMDLLPSFALLRKVIASQRALEQIHERFKAAPTGASQKVEPSARR